MDQFTIIASPVVEFVTAGCTVSRRRDTMLKPACSPLKVQDSVSSKLYSVRYGARPGAGNG